MDSLSLEMLQLIASHVSLTDKKSLRLVDRRWRDAINTPRLLDNASIRIASLPELLGNTFHTPTLRLSLLPTTKAKKKPIVTFEQRYVRHLELALCPTVDKNDYIRVLEMFPRLLSIKILCCRPSAQHHHRYIVCKSFTFLGKILKINCPELRKFVVPFANGGTMNGAFLAIVKWNNRKLTEVYFNGIDERYVERALGRLGPQVIGIGGCKAGIKASVLYSFPKMFPRLKKLDLSRMEDELSDKKLSKVLMKLPHLTDLSLAERKLESWLTLAVIAKRNLRSFDCNKNFLTPYYFQDLNMSNPNGYTFRDLRIIPDNRNYAISKSKDLAVFNSRLKSVECMSTIVTKKLVSSLSHLHPTLKYLECYLTAPPSSLNVFTELEELCIHVKPNFDYNSLKKVKLPHLKSFCCDGSYKNLDAAGDIIRKFIRNHPLLEHLYFIHMFSVDKEVRKRVGKLQIIFAGNLQCVLSPITERRSGHKAFGIVPWLDGTVY